MEWWQTALTAGLTTIGTVAGGLLGGGVQPAGATAPANQPAAAPAGGVNWPMILLIAGGAAAVVWFISRK